MPVFTRHHLSTSVHTVVPLEAFPSIERAGRALQLRARKQVSSTYFWTDRPPGGGGLPGREHPFPEADTTGFMEVWLRSPSEGPPPAGQDPDELWHMAPTGGLRREKWEDLKEAQRLPSEGSGVSVPEEVRERAMTPAQRRTKALAYGQQMPPVTDEFNLNFGGIPRRMLEALVPDEEALDVVLRLLQETWKASQK